MSGVRYYFPSSWSWLRVRDWFWQRDIFGEVYSIERDDGIKLIEIA